MMPIDLYFLGCTKEASSSFGTWVVLSIPSVILTLLYLYSLEIIHTMELYFRISNKEIDTP